MRLVVERSARTDQGRVTFSSTVRVIPEQPMPRSTQYLADVPLEDLAEWWFVLQDQRVEDDRNAVLVQRAENWTGATLRAMINSGGLKIAAASPIVIAAVEERLLRALALFTISDDYDEALLKSCEEVINFPSANLAPTGKLTTVIDGRRPRPRRRFVRPHR